MRRTRTCFRAAMAVAAAIVTLACFDAAAQDDIPALIAQARESAERNETDGAIKTLDQVIEKDPENQEARKLRGELHLKIGDMDKAMADFGALRTEQAAAAVAAAPRPPRADWLPIIAERFRNASAEFARGSFDAAIDHFNAILAMDVPHQTASVAVQNRGNAYRAKRDSERALRDFEQAIRLDSRNAGAYVNRGSILAERGDHDSAILDYNEAIRFDPKISEAYYNRGVSFAVAERWDAALRDFNETIRLNPTSAGARVARGELFMVQKKTKQARADFEAATRLDPKAPSAWLGLARLDQQGGKFTAAAANLEKVIKHAPEVPVVLNFSAWLHATAPIAAARDGKKAVARALKACELTEWREFGYVDTLAAAYAEVGDFDKAVGFQWYALGLIEGEDEHPNRAEAEERLALFQRREKYRESKPRDDAQPGSPAKKGGPNATPTPPLSPQPNGRVGMSSPQLPQSGDREDSGRALLRSCA